MSRKLLRFPLAATAQGPIVGTSIQVDDGPASFPDSMRIRFDLPLASSAPRISPLCGGRMFFFPDPSAAGATPSVPGAQGAFDVTTWVDVNHANWRTIGTLVIDVDNKVTAALASALGFSASLAKGEQLANRVWYWPVHADSAFLKAMVSQMPRRKISLAGGAGAVATDDPLWPAHAVVGFLTGRVDVVLQQDGTTPANDTAVRNMMPSLVKDPGQGNVELWVALAIAREPMDDRQDAVVDAVAAAEADLAPLRPLEATNARIALLHPAHPRNAPLQTRVVLRTLRNQLIDGEAGNQLADAVLADPSNDQVYHQIHVQMPGVADQPYFKGLVTQESIRVEDAAGAVLQERPVPAHGLVSLAAGANAVVNISFPTGPLRVTRTNGNQTGVSPDNVLIDFGAVGSFGEITLQPPAPNPADAAAVLAYSRQLAEITHALTNTLSSRRLVDVRLMSDEAAIRPDSWAASDLVFRGTRDPHAGVSKEDLTGFFNGLQRVHFTVPNHPPVRPRDALILWIMEGKLNATKTATDTKGVPGVGLLRSRWVRLDAFGDVVQFDPNDITNATTEQIKQLFRVLFLWTFWGADIFNVHLGAGSDNRPILGGNLADALAQHQAEMAKRLADIAAAGITPPTREQVTGAITVQKASGVWQCRATANHIETYVWLQYSEYLRRLLQIPAAARECPAFAYIAYNGGIGAATNLWNQSDQIVLADPGAWAGKTHEDALKSWKLTADEINRTPRNQPGVRSIAARVNGLHARF